MRFAAAVMIVLSAAPADARCRAGHTASWYGEPQRLSGGGVYDPDAETCASRTAAAGTVLRVTDLDTGLAVDCAVNDFGPAKWTGCQVDLSRKSAERLGMTERGVIRARIEAAPGASLPALPPNASGRAAVAPGRK